MKKYSQPRINIKKGENHCYWVKGNLSKKCQLMSRMTSQVGGLRKPCVCRNPLVKGFMVLSLLPWPGPAVYCRQCFPWPGAPLGMLPDRAICFPWAVPRRTSARDEISEGWAAWTPAAHGLSETTSRTPSSHLRCSHARSAHLHPQHCTPTLIMCSFLPASFSEDPHVCSQEQLSVAPMKQCCPIWMTATASSFYGTLCCIWLRSFDIQTGNGKLVPNNSRLDKRPNQANNQPLTQN